MLKLFEEGLNGREGFDVVEKVGLVCDLGPELGAYGDGGEHREAATSEGQNDCRELSSRASVCNIIDLYEIAIPLFPSIHIPAAL